jgi:hypothetical protein
VGHCAHEGKHWRLASIAPVHGGFDGGVEKSVYVHAAVQENSKFSGLHAPATKEKGRPPDRGVAPFRFWLRGHATI